MFCHNILQYHLCQGPRQLLVLGNELLHGDHHLPAELLRADPGPGVDRSPEVGPELHRKEAIGWDTWDLDAPVQRLPHTSDVTT